MNSQDLAWQDMIKGLQSKDTPQEALPSKKQLMLGAVWELVMGVGTYLMYTVIASASIGYVSMLMLDILHSNWSTSIPAMGYWPTVGLTFCSMFILRSRMFRLFHNMASKMPRANIRVENHNG